MKIKGLLVGLVSVALMGVFQQASAIYYDEAEYVVVKNCNIEDEGSGKHYLVINYEGYKSKGSKTKANTINLDVGVKIIDSEGRRISFTKDISLEESEFRIVRVFLGYSFEYTGNNGKIDNVQFYTNKGKKVTTQVNNCSQEY